MKKTFKLSFLISIFLSITVLFSSISLFAASTDEITISDAEHKQIIEQFLNEIKAMENQTADIALSALKSSPSENRQLKARINLLNSNIERLNKIMQDYLSTVPNISERTRHVLLTFNVLNLVKSSLYSLSLLVDTQTDAERLAFLDEYFRSRVASLDTLGILENILSKYNT